MRPRVVEKTLSRGRVRAEALLFLPSLGGTLKPLSAQAPLRLHSELLLGLIRDFQSALGTLDPIDEPVIPCVKRGIGADQVAQMSNNSGLAVLKIDHASAVFPVRIARFGQLLPDHAQLLKDQIFDFFVHCIGTCVRRALLRAPGLGMRCQFPETRSGWSNIDRRRDDANATPVAQRCWRKNEG